MNVRCICDTISNNNSSPAIVKWSNNSDLEITVGKTYTVFAITKFFDVIFYYILGDESDKYPLSFPHYLFLIEDNKTSKYWNTNLNMIDKPDLIKIENGEVISFKEWTYKKDMFYENLLEENQNEVSLFISYRDKILSE
jgi:hypothetical protein